MFFKSKKQPSWLLEYKQQTPISKKTPEEEIEYAVVDIESTGFDIHRDRILSIAIAVIKNSRIETKRIREWKVYQKNTAVNEAMKVHGILPSETQSGVEEKQVIEELIPLISGKIIIGHHINFDAAMINAAMERYLHTRFRNQLIDTAQLSMSEVDAFKKSGYSNQQPPSLDDVCAQLGIKAIDRHTAIGDVYTTAQLFLLLRARAKKKRGDRFGIKHLPLFKY